MWFFGFFGMSFIFIILKKKDGFRFDHQIDLGWGLAGIERRGLPYKKWIFFHTATILYVCISSLLILLCHTLIVVMCTTKRKLSKYFSTSLQYYIYLRIYPVKITSELTPTNSINKKNTQVRSG